MLKKTGLLDDDAIANTYVFTQTMRPVVSENLARPADSEILSLHCQSRPPRCRRACQRSGSTVEPSRTRWTSAYVSEGRNRRYVQ